MRKSLILLVFFGSLTACADRTRVNCERVKNKAATATASMTTPGGGRC